MARISNDLIGAAGVHYVVSELSLRGLVALPTTRNTTGIDVLVFDPATNSHASIQVKASQHKNQKWWITSKPDKCLKGSNAFYVFLRLQPDKGGEKHFEAFLDSADNVVRRIQRELDELRKKGRKEIGGWGFSSQENQERFASNWKNWKPPSQP